MWPETPEFPQKPPDPEVGNSPTLRDPSTSWGGSQWVNASASSLYGANFEGHSTRLPRVFLLRLSPLVRAVISSVISLFQLFSLLSPLLALLLIIPEVSPQTTHTLLSGKPRLRHLCKPFTEKLSIQHITKNKNYVLRKVTGSYSKLLVL